MATSAELQKQLEFASAEVDSALSIWRDDQAELLGAFLDEEAKLTAVNQAAHTESIGSQVPELRRRLFAARDEAVEAFLEWAKSADRNLQNLKAELNDDTNELVKAWVDVLLQYNYAGGSSSWLGGAKAARWNFYQPSTGTARTPYLPTPKSLDALDAAVRKRAHIAGLLKAAREAEQKERAADLWDK
jgi:predicted NBD/HSP70 family sugar kinase